MGKKLIPSGGEDRVMTPSNVVKAIIDHYKPFGRVLEPCRGTGAFFDELALSNEISKLDYAEIDEGLDFFNINNKHYDFIVTNPPFSQFRAFLNHAMDLADNVIFLSMVNAFFMRARLRDMKEKGFVIKSIMFIDHPPKPFVQTGIQLGVTHIEKVGPGYKGNCEIGYLKT